MLETNIEASPRHAIASVRFCIESLLGRFLMRFQGIPHTRVIQHDGDNPQPCPKRNDRRRECELERLERPCDIKTEVRWRNNWTKVSSIPLYWSTSSANDRSCGPGVQSICKSRRGRDRDLPPMSVGSSRLAIH